MTARKRITVDSTSEWTIVEVELPKKIRLRRIRAIMEDAGDVAVSFREADPVSSSLDAVVEYALAPGPLDSEEDLYAEAGDGNAKRGNFYIAIKSSVDTEVTCQVEYDTQ